jgi:methionyl-tRNA formyltransferase
MGTFNLHASLLPQYRGAAPINWVIINGEKETGVTTFFLDDKIDTGNIIFNHKTLIGEGETAGELHDRLMKMGAELVLKTVDAIAEHQVTGVSQEFLMTAGLVLKKAPKIHKARCNIDWNEKVTDIYNLIRGLSPHPGAYTTLTSFDGKSHYLKVYRSLPEICIHSMKAGKVVTDGRTYFKVAASDGYIKFIEVQQAGRKPMQIVDFMRGFGRLFA